MTERLDICKQVNCNNKTLNYTGIVMTNPEHMLKTQYLVTTNNTDILDVFNNCKKCWLKLMEEL